MSSSGISFKFSKNLEKKSLCKNVENEEEEENDFITEVSEREIKGSRKKKAEKKELVIKCLVKNTWKTKAAEKEKADKTDEDNKPKTEDELAAEEVLKQSRGELEDWENRDKKNNVPLLIQNVVPNGFETEEKLDVGLRAEVPTLDDYETVPIEEYGLAMLRGMGWKPGEGIGGFQKRVVDCIDPLTRPKGLGLGASKPQFENKVKDGEEKLELKAGAYVIIKKGSSKGSYGIVEGMDEESARVFVKLALGGKTESVSENVIKLVTKKEYKDTSRVLNKEIYEKYREKQKEREEEWRKADEKKRKPDNEDQIGAKKKPRRRRYQWVRAMLRVRFIDKKYKNGKYYNTKMIIEDVNETCICRSEVDNRILEDVDQEYLETVIPKSDDSVVMIVKGPNKGQLGQILKRDKKNYLAVVQIIQNPDVVEKLDYEDICEYTGDVSDQLY